MSGLDHIANFINALDSEGMSGADVAECMSAKIKAKFPDSDAAVQIAEEAFRAGFEAAALGSKSWWDAWCEFETSEAAKELVE